MNLNELKKKKNDLVTYAIVVAMFLVVAVMVFSGMASRHMQSMLVPICIYIILAV